MMPTPIEPDRKRCPACERDGLVIGQSGATKCVECGRYEVDGVAYNGKPVPAGHVWIEEDEPKLWRQHHFRFHARETPGEGTAIEIDGKPVPQCRAINMRAAVGEVNRVELELIALPTDIDVHGCIVPIVELVGAEEESVARGIYARLKARFDPE